MDPNEYENNIDGNYEFYFNISIRKCISGEIYDNSINTYISLIIKIYIMFSCYKCPPGKFSLDPSEKECKECPPHAFCESGNQINVNKGNNY